MICPHCQEDKPIEAFGKARWRKSGLTYRCKQCGSQSAREWAKKNPDKRKEQADRAYEKWRSRNPVREPLFTAEGKLCRVCNTRKSESEFVLDKRGKNGFGWRCKLCAKEAIARWYADRPFRIRYPKTTNSTLLDMWNAQNGKCAICERDIQITGVRKHAGAAHVDHCHKSGAVRALLCPHCNVGLGSFREDKILFLKAIEYLAKYEA